MGRTSPKRIDFWTFDLSARFLITEVHVYKVLPYKKDLMVSSEIWKTSREKMTTSESGKISIPKVLSASWWPSSEI